MRLNGRRESSNVEDRRGVSGGVGTKAGLGIGGIILIAVVTFLSGGNIGDVVTENIYNFFHSEENYQQNEKTAYRMGENICK
mgnify:CR=1 FL=1